MQTVAQLNTMRGQARSNSDGRKKVGDCLLLGNSLSDARFGANQSEPVLLIGPMAATTDAMT